jgi:hypothetical protein
MQAKKQPKKAVKKRKVVLKIEPAEDRKAPRAPGGPIPIPYPI